MMCGRGYDDHSAPINRAGRASGGCRWRGALPIPENAHPIVRLLFAEMNRQHTNMAEVSKRAGLSRATIALWARDNQPSLANIEAALNALGLDLRVVEKDEP